MLPRDSAKNDSRKVEKGRLRRSLVKKYEKRRAWEGDDPRRQAKTYYALYTLCFVILAFAVLFVYPSNGRSLVWHVDGLEQYYPFFVYEGQWLREVANSFLAGSPAFPQWTMSLGYGSDILPAIDAFADPLNLLSGLCPESMSEWLFQVLIVFRLFLAGLTFSALARFFKNGRFAVLCGALAYSLCATAMVALHWPAGMIPMILFPLLLLGVEKLLAGGRPYLFILAAAAFFFTSYYFAYMACLLLLIYCTVRVITVNKPCKAGVFLRWVARFAGYLVIGILISCVLLVPGVVALLGVDRVYSGAVEIPFFYDLGYYSSVLAGFISVGEAGSDCLIGYGGISLVAAVALFSHKGNRGLKIFFVSMTVFLLVPAIGSVFNGFNYATNRWVWAYALCVAYVIVKAVPLLAQADAPLIKRTIVVLAVYALAVFLLPTARRESTMAALVVAVALVVLLLSRSMLSPSMWRVGLLACISLGLGCSVFYLASPDEGGWGKASAPLGSLYSKITAESPNAVVASIEDDSVWRYDASGSNATRTRNASLVSGLNGFDFYNSIYNSSIDRFHAEMGIVETNINASYKHLDSRSILETINGVKYFLAQEAPTESNPYNYDDPENIVAKGTVRNVPYVVYEGEEVLPLAFTYANYIDRAAYEIMTPAQKQESLLQGVVLEGSDTIPQLSPRLTSESIPYELTASPDVTVADDRIEVHRPGATVTLSFEGLPDAETYLYLDKLNFKALSPMDDTPHKVRDNMSWYRKADLVKRSLEWRAPENYSIYATSNATTAKCGIENSSEDNHLHGEKDTWLLNVGYAPTAQNTITLSFSQPGMYSFDSLEVVCQPMDSFDTQVGALQADVLDSMKIGTNTISGSIDLDTAKALYFSIPYSEGWVATVDGVKTPLKKANTAFMALELEPGHHDIELHFTSPGLVGGAILSGVGLALLLALVLFYRVRTSRQKEATLKAAASQTQGSSHA